MRITPNIDQAKKLITFCRQNGVNRFKLGFFEIDLSVKPIESMNLDPKELSKILTESTPPDSSMLFASVEEYDSEKLTPEQRDNRFDG